MRLHRTSLPFGMAMILGGFFLILWAPAASGQVPVVRADFPAADSEVPITQWQLLGPFRFDKKDIEAPGADRLPVGLSRDYLKDFGQDEASIDAAAFPLVVTPKSEIKLDPRFSNKLVHTTPRSNILELAYSKHPIDYSIAYAAVVVESPRDQDIVIAAGARRIVEAKPAFDS